MRTSMQGFKQFLFEQAGPVSSQEGIAELERLEKGHYLLVNQTWHDNAWRFITSRLAFGNNGLKGAAPTTFNLLQKMIQMINGPGKEGPDSLIIMAIPKRWFRKTQQKGSLMQAIEALLPSNRQLPNNYIWGIFSKWNPNFEKLDQAGIFYRNPNYHANDSMYEQAQRSPGTAPPPEQIGQQPLVQQAPSNPAAPQFTMAQNPMPFFNQGF